MEELSIREVTRENWRAALRLAVHPEQQRFIADGVPIAAIALAKAYIRPGGLVWLPYAFYRATEMIGFTELAYEPESSDNYWMFHFFIDIAYQGQGYGKKIDCSSAGSSPTRVFALTICSRSTFTCPVITCSIVPCSGLAIQRIIEDRNNSFR